MMWPSYRKFVIDQIVPESAFAKSIYLRPADGQPLAPYLPGQHLPLRLAIPGANEPIYRLYTLSDCFHGQDRYRLTIKKEAPPADKPHLPGGLSSGYFTDIARAGDVIEAKAPNGNFYLDVTRQHPVVFIAGGIGVTPLLAMVNAVVRQQPTRPVWFFFALRGKQDHVFREHLSQISQNHPNIKLFVAYDRVGPGDVHGTDYHMQGRIDAAFLASVLPTLQLEYYICGPSPMMRSLIGGLQEAGVGSGQIKTESFGPASYQEKLGHSEPQPTTAEPQTVTFQRSRKTIPWDPKARSLWHFADQHQVEISSGCLYGDCGTCTTRLLAGQVAYVHTTAASVDAGACLPCSCKPVTSIVLDA
jgi:ferredoxin-NADP reductase